MLSAVSSPSSSSLLTMQSLRSLNSQVSTLQGQIATGKRVSTAKDDAAAWSLSNSLSTDLAVNKEFVRSLSTSSSIVSAAQSGAEAVVEFLQNLKITAAQYQANSKTATDAAAALTTTAAGIADLIASAKFRDADNLLTAAAADLTITINGAGGSITVAKKAMDTVQSDLTTALGTAASYTDINTAINTALTSAKDYATHFGSAAKRIETQSTLLSKLNDTLSSAVSNLVDTNMDEAAARLTALQTQQQLATQLLSITSQNQSSLVQTLFRGF